MKNKLILFTIVFFALFFSLSFSSIYAFEDVSGNGPPEETTNTNSPNSTSYKITIPNPLKNGADSLPELLNLIIDSIIIPLGSVVIVVMIIYSGFLFVTAQGNETKITTAKNSILYAVIGAA